MTGKECVHYERCKWNADTLRDAGLLVDFTDDDELASERCIFFKNKANFVELPCKLGSEIYMLVTRHTKSFAFDNGKMVMRENQHTIVKKTTFTKSNFFKVIEQFGKTVFLTKEEAEQKLKGCADNGNRM
jgi:hypothetical protein